ncbi:MAG: hypothetical protein IKZ19_05330, partial [Clostridia bacterium]|nr:hypothetical protein [Clostridia bacterium]
PEAILRHFRGHRYNLFRECIDELGAGPINPETFPGLRQLFRENYADIIDYCANLPNALETEDLVFTHAGLGEWENWKDSSEQEVMKNDPFIKTGRNTTGKWLICGHMPTWNTPLSGNSNNCIVDGNRKCVFIDGGNQVKDFAQLNLLFISSHNGQVEFETAFESWYPVFFAAEDFVPVFDSGCDKDRWPEPEMKVMGDKNGFVECERADGTVCLAHPSHIRIADGRAVYVRNSVSSLLKVAKGEKLELLDAPGGELLFVRKASGEIGWVDRRVLM